MYIYTYDLYILYIYAYIDVCVYSNIYIYMYIHSSICEVWCHIPNRSSRLRRHFRRLPFSFTTWSTSSLSAFKLKDKNGNTSPHRCAARWVCRQIIATKTTGFSERRVLSDLRKKVRFEPFWIREIRADLNYLSSPNNFVARQP